MLTVTWGTDILFYELRAEAGGDEFEKYPLLDVSFLGWGFHAKPVFFNIFSGDPHFDALIIGLPNYWLDYWRRCNLQKQSPRGVLQKKCSWKFRKIHRKTLLQSLFFLQLC